MSQALTVAGSIRRLTQPLALSRLIPCYTVLSQIEVILPACVIVNRNRQHSSNRVSRKLVDQKLQSQQKSREEKLKNIHRDTAAHL